MKTKTKFHYFIYSFAFVVALNYGVEVTNTPIEFIKKYGEMTGFTIDNTVIVSLIAVFTSIGAATAQFTLTPITQRLKLFNSFFVFVGIDVIVNALACIPVHCAYLMVCLFAIGWCTGSYLSLIPIMASNEIEPAKRGMYMTMVSISINLGLLVGYLINLVVSSIDDQYSCYWLFYFVNVMLCCIALVLLWQTTVQKKLLEAETPDSEVVLVQQKSIVTNSEQKQTKISETEVTQEKFKYSCKQMVRMVFMSIILGTVQMTTGINSMLAYASVIFAGVFNDKRSGIYGSLIVGICNEIAVCIAFPIIHRVKRIRLLTIGLMGCVATNIVIACTFAFSEQLTSKTADSIKISMFVLYVLFYQLAPGPIILMQCGEVFPRELKVKLGSVGFAFNWGWNIIIIFTYRFFTGIEYIIHSLYATVTFALTIVTIFITPETYNKSETEIEKEIQAW